jgi:acetoin utilization protein AcuB
MMALARLVGVHEPGSRLEIALPDHPGSLAEVTGIVRDQGVNIVSLLVPSGPEDTGERIAVLRLATINPKGVVDGLREAGYPVLWPPEPGAERV